MGTGRSASGNPDSIGSFVRTSPTKENLARIIRGFAPDVILHAAGTASVSASLEDPLGDFHGATSTCAELLEAVRQSNQKTLVVIPSSAAVYGNSALLPVKEEATLQPISPYGFHKVACELLAREYAECFGLHVLVCRLFSVFGPRQRRLLVWELFRQLSGSETTAWLDGTGAESRDFLYIDDLAGAVFQLAEYLVDGPSLGRFEIINIGSGRETSVIDLANQMRDLIAPDKDVRCRGIKREGDPRRWRADISKLRSLAPAWEARPLTETLAECFSAWRQEAVFGPKP